MISAALIVTFVFAGFIQGFTWYIVAGVLLSAAFHEPVSSIDLTCRVLERIFRGRGNTSHVEDQAAIQELRDQISKLNLKAGFMKLKTEEKV